MATGALVLFLFMVFVLHFRTGERPVGQLAFKTKRVDLVARMRLNLASASEAEKSAVLAINDQDSKTFADQARATTLEVDKEHNELGKLLAAGGAQGEKDLLVQFSKIFIELKSIDSDLFVLAVRNTNIKAYGLAFGPATDALKDMNTALSSLVEKSATLPEARNVALLACGAQIAALRIQTLLAPHIAEESEMKMSELEAQMTREDYVVRKDLNGLSGVEEFRTNPDLESALTSYARFSELRSKILVLSHENTNVKSLTISLGRKRKVLFMCQDILSALQQTIIDEPIMGLNNGSASNPRSMQVGKDKNR